MGAKQPCLQEKDRGDRGYRAPKMFSHSQNRGCCLLSQFRWGIVDVVGILVTVGVGVGIEVVYTYWEA